MHCADIGIVAERISSENYIMFVINGFVSVVSVRLDFCYTIVVSRTRSRGSVVDFRYGVAVSKSPSRGSVVDFRYGVGLSRRRSVVDFHYEVAVNRSVAEVHSEFPSRSCREQVP